MTKTPNRHFTLQNNTYSEHNASNATTFWIAPNDTGWIVLTLSAPAISPSPFLCGAMAQISRALLKIPLGRRRGSGRRRCGRRWRPRRLLIAVIGVDTDQLAPGRYGLAAGVDRLARKINHPVDGVASGIRRRSGDRRQP